MFTTENCFGPFKNIVDAVEAVENAAGSGFLCIIMKANEQQYYSNDGIDPATGLMWSRIPRNAFWIEMDEWLTKD